MRCPNCGTVCKSSQQVWQEKRQAQGRCITCGNPKNQNDMPHLKCLPCRRKSSDAGIRRRARIAARARGVLGI